MQVPFIFKEAIDFFNKHTGDVLAVSDPSSTVFTFGVALLIGCKYFLLNSVYLQFALLV